METRRAMLGGFYRVLGGTADRRLGRSLPLLEPVEAVASSADVRCEQGDFLERPAEPRRDHALRHAWRAVLTGDEAIASNMGPCSAGPRLKPQPCGRQVWAVGVKVEDDLEQVSDVSDDDGTTRTIPQPLGVTVEDSLLDDSSLARGTETARQVAPEPGRMATQWPSLKQGRPMPVDRLEIGLGPQRLGL